MKFRDVVFLAFRSLRSNPLETILEVCATALGVALFASSLSLIQHYRKDFAEASAELRFRTITAQYSRGFEAGTADTPLRISNDVATKDLLLPVALLEQAKRDCPAVTHAWADEQWGYGGNDESNAQHFYSVNKVAGEYFAANGLRVVQGSLFSQTDHVAGSRSVILGARIARLRFGTAGVVGSAWTAEPTGTVIGVLAPHPERFEPKSGASALDDTVFLPLPVTASTWALEFSVADAADLDAAIGQLRAFFDTTIGKDAITVQSQRGWVQAEKRMSEPLLRLIAFAAGSILLVVAVCILSLQVGSIARRTRTIGLAAAVGAARRDLFWQFAAEFFLVGLAGAVLGMVAAIGLTAALQGVVNPQGIALPGLRVAASPIAVGAAAVVVLLLNFLFAVLPALQALRTKAADAMRYE
jgi:putative ABC transport system permease protein